MAYARKPVAASSDAAGVVLLVDDDRDVRELHSLLLRLSGYVVFEACDGVEALALLRRVRPHVILLDLQMPNMDGRQFLERLRSRPDRADVPVCVVSGQPLDETIRVDAFLRKPFVEPALLEMVERLVKDRRAQ
jgi:CheY-like chemotaxis protein